MHMYQRDWFGVESFFGIEFVWKSVQLYLNESYVGISNEENGMGEHCVFVYHCFIVEIKMSFIATHLEQ